MNPIKGNQRREMSNYPGREEGINQKAWKWRKIWSLTWPDAYTQSRTERSKMRKIHAHFPIPHFLKNWSNSNAPETKTKHSGWLYYTWRRRKWPGSDINQNRTGRTTRRWNTPVNVGNKKTTIREEIEIIIALKTVFIHQVTYDVRTSETFTNFKKIDFCIRLLLQSRVECNNKIGGNWKSL